MKKNYHLYLGKAGHLTVMSEFLTRGWNVAIPEVDVGDDIFVVQDDNGTLRRVQEKNQHPLKQLRNLANIPVHYVFILRNSDLWTKPVIIRQDYLLDYLQNEKIGSESEGNLNLYFSYSNDKIACSGLDLSKYISDFNDFPFIEE